MNGGGGDQQSPPLPGGEFLLQMLQRKPRQHQSQTPSHPLPRDPIVSPVGPTIPQRPIQFNGHDLTPPRPHFAPHAFMHGYPQNPNSKIQSSSPPLSDSFRNLGLYQDDNSVPNCDTRSFLHSGDKINGFSDPSKTHEGNWQFNRFADNFYNSSDGIRNPRVDTREGNMRLNLSEADFRNFPNSSGNGSNRILNGSGSKYQTFPNSSVFGEGSYSAMNGFESDYQNFPTLNRIGEGYNRQLNGFVADHRNSANSNGFGEGYGRVLNGFDPNFPNLPNYNINQGTIMSRTAVVRPEARQPPPGFWNKPKNGDFRHNVDKEKTSSNGLRNHGIRHEDERKKSVMRADLISERRVSLQLDLALPTGSALHSVSGFDIEESLSELHNGIDENDEKSTKVGGLGTIQGYSDEERESREKNQNTKRNKDYRSDTRGQNALVQRKRMSKRTIECHRNIEMLNAPLLAIYDSLVPSEEEKLKQKQLLDLLEKLVINEWPHAQLLVYGSCANSFGVKNSDIDICLAMKDANVNKSETLLRLADILKAEKFDNVQALTRARVPIVKLMDPVTGISCDICINNVLAVVNSKLLRDYAKIDDRLRQLAFIVKHWAKSRGVNETYHGTLSSYAYVLMCIHYLQQCQPAILPCLQGMNTTYSVIVDDVECTFFDQVEKLSGYGLRNRESIGHLVWGFFRYWAYCHDYAHDVISVRLACTISKRGKDWTKRVGNDRHLICIEDPFETSHDLGRVVDKRSIKVLREEFERAAEILQFDPNPCVTLFEPYIPS